MTDCIEVLIDTDGRPRKVGLLRRTPGSGREGVLYAHDPAWLNDPAVFELDPMMPLVQGNLHPDQGHVLFGALSDCVPDRWGRTLMIRNERRAAEREKREPRVFQETDYLLGSTDETRLGALRFRMEGDEAFLAPRACGVPSLVQLEGLVEASRRVQAGEDTDEDLRSLFLQGSSLGGALPKASVRDRHGNLSIAKFPKESDGWSISRWEAIALGLARRCGIDTAEHELVETRHGPVLVSRRFDRSGNLRIPFASAMTLTRHRDGDEDCSYLELVEVLCEHGARPVVDRVELFRRIAFTVLIRNCDDHMRNHGFLRDGRYGWRLSPCYDVNPAPDNAGTLSTRIDETDSTASIELLRSVSEFFLKLDEGDRVIRECADAVRDWRAFARQMGAPDSEIRIMEPAFEHEDAERASRL